MKAVVLFESMTGNTRRAAELIGGALAAQGDEVSVRPVTDIDFHELAIADVAFIGTWVDGLVLFGQRPGRAGRLRRLPVLDHRYRKFHTNEEQLLTNLVAQSSGSGCASGVHVEKVDQQPAFSVFQVSRSCGVPS